MDIAKLFRRDPNTHVVGCLDPEASGEVKRVVYARVPHDATHIRFFCGYCGRYHSWALDPKLREKGKK